MMSRMTVQRARGNRKIHRLKERANPSSPPLLFDPRNQRAHLSGVLPTSCVIYARVSSEEQREEGFSIEAQQGLLREYARKNGLEVAKEFVDVESAKRAGRTNFVEMLNFVRAGQGKYDILVEKTDRLTRNFKDYVTTQELIDKFGVKIHLVKESEVMGRDSRSHQKFIHGIKVLMAKNYIDNLSEETAKGMKEKAAQGLWPSTAPLGYRNHGKFIEIDAERAPLVKKLFEHYASGAYSLKQLTRWAKENGLRSKKGAPVNRSCIEGILKNPLYYGEFCWKGSMYQGKHPPIVSKVLFEAVDDALVGHQRHRGPRTRAFAFTGLMTCGHCGCAITAEIKKERYVYYRCTNYRGKCPQTYVKEDVIIRLFAEKIAKIQIPAEHLEWVRETLKDSHKDEKVFHDEAIESLDKQYKQLQQRLDQMYIDKLDGRISEEFYQEKYRAWREEQQDLRVAKANHEKVNRNYMDEGLRILELCNSIYPLFLKQNQFEQRKLLNFVLSNCILKDVTLTITYSKPFCWIAESAQTENWRPEQHRLKLENHFTAYLAG